MNCQSWAYLKVFILCFSLVCIWGCDQDSPADQNNLTVDIYVEQLKRGEYESLALPAFTREDITALLVYRNETEKIVNFPTNGISSYHLPECSLGMYILWNIEYIRAVATDSELLTGRFPSLNPIIEQREAPYELVFGSDAQAMVAEVYYNWWENYKNMDFNDFKFIDPLVDFHYRWH